jgi:hypothetical protein
VPAAKIVIPEELPVSPVGLVCPFCKAKPGQDCASTSGGFASVHLARMQAAALATRKNKLIGRHTKRKS